jgi:hypothetical protein
MRGVPKMDRDEVMEKLWDLEEEFGVHQVYYSLLAYLTVDDLKNFEEDFSHLWRNS